MSGDPRLILDHALADLVKHGRRLQMSSVANAAEILDKSLKAAKEEPSFSQTKAAKPKPGGTLTRLWRRLRKSEDGQRTPRGIQDQAPPAPPPSPRYPLAVELAVALEQTKQLMDEYRKTDELADQLIEEATETNRELVLQSQLQRHSGLVQDMEVEYSEDYMYIQLEALRAEFDEVEASPPGDASAEEEMLVNP